MPTLSRLTDSIFAGAAVLPIFSDTGTIEHMLRVESALARAQAHCGVIPQDAAAAIAAECDAAVIDADALARAAAAGGNLAIPLVKQLTARVNQRDAVAGRYVHWGATSQDIIDTGLVLQLTQALDIMRADLVGLAQDCAVLADRHRGTLMAARTWLQHALPTTFGLKAAGWLDALRRDLERLDGTRQRANTLQLGGAAGTLASLGADGLAVAAETASLLGLDLPVLPWHTHRDRLAEVATTLGMLTGTLGKMARDISLMMQTEVAEVAEPAAQGRGASSTMPHKRNPVGCAATLTAATRVPALVSTVLSGMIQEHERALGGWQAEWDTLPEIVVLCAGALENMHMVVGGLEVDAVRMRANLDLTNGLLVSEAAMLALGTRIGRLPAHDLLEIVSHRTLASKIPFQTALAEVLAETPACQGLLDAEALERICDPANYTGQSGLFIDRALQAWAGVA